MLSQIHQAADEQEAAAWRELAEALEALPNRPPNSFLEAVQLMWIYALTSTTWNYGRMDVYLGPFLARDLDFTALLAEQQMLEYQVTAREVPYLLISLLTHDCLERGRSAFDGGVRYLGGTLETYGNINTADALTAIEECVYRRREFSLCDVLEACTNNFEDRPDLRKKLLQAPKFGNDHACADAMAARVHDHICRVTREQAERVGLHHYLVVIINNSANVNLGQHTRASADGRLAGDAMANAVNPFPGMDRSGTTAFLNSLVKLDPSHHAGAVHNMKFSRDMFIRHRPELEALLGTYFAEGGTQAMISVLSRDDLESALKEPEKWGHLMVRVGGYSARFIDLSADIQYEILRRTLHE